MSSHATQPAGTTVSQVRAVQEETATAEFPYRVSRNALCNLASVLSLAPFGFGLCLAPQPQTAEEVSASSEACADALAPLLRCLPDDFGEPRSGGEAWDAAELEHAHEDVSALLDMCPDYQITLVGREVHRAG